MQESRPLAVHIERAMAANPSAFAGDRFPLPHTPLIGREREIREVRQRLLGSGFPLLTLTGPAGVGKTRVALSVASSLRSRFVDGVWIVPLAPVRGAEHVPAAVARALGVREPAGASGRDQCIAFLASRQGLLVLDNFEHVAEAAPIVGELVAKCPGLRLLVTSRTRLDLTCERIRELAPLPLPAAADGRFDAVARSPAVHLFVERARAAWPEFALTPANAAAVAAICRRLDGLPLALELAAAWVRILPIDTLLVRLQSRLPLLIGGARDQPARLQTMRDAIAWSHDLLTEEERTLFRRLAVFAGGFTLEAAEWVAGAGSRVPEPATSGRPPHTQHPPPATLNLVAALVDKSLLTSCEHGDSGASPRRFTMLETVREFSAEQLDASGETDATRRAHAAWLLDRAGHAWVEDFHVGLAPAAAWFAEWDGEFENLRAALDWAEAHGEPDVVLRLLGALFVYWYSGRDSGDVRARLKRALAASRGDDQSVRATALVALSALSHQHDEDLELSVRAAREAYDIRRDLGERLGAGYACYLLAIATYRRGDLTAAEALYEEAIGLTQTATSLAAVSEMHAGLGQVKRERGDLAGSTVCYQRAIWISRDADAGWSLAVAKYGCGATAYARGDHASAADLFAQSLRYWAEIHDPRSTAACVEGLAWVACGQNAPSRAARLLGAADAMRERVQAPLPCRAWAAYGGLVKAVRSALGEQAFASAWLAGRALGAEEAIDEALARDCPPRSCRNGSHGRGSAETLGLTSRELEVLRLVAEGHTNPTIAASLFISRRTVSHHVASILRKLDAPSRSGAVATATRQGIL